LSVYHLYPRTTCIYLTVFYPRQSLLLFFFFFFFNDTAPTEIYTLSLHDALPILKAIGLGVTAVLAAAALAQLSPGVSRGIILLTDRKSTRLNSSHVAISYAVFCLKKKKKRSNR